MDERPSDSHLCASQSENLFATWIHGARHDATCAVLANAASISFGSSAREGLSVEGELNPCWWDSNFRCTVGFKDAHCFCVQVLKLYQLTST